jgi:hypothetical protein
VNPENKEDHSHTGTRRRGGGNSRDQEEGSGERTIHQDSIPKNPSQTKAEKKMKDLITKLERRCDILSEVVQRHKKGKASLVDNLLQKTTSPFTDQVATFLLLERFKVPYIPIYIGLEDPIESTWKISGLTWISTKYLMKWHAEPFLSPYQKCSGLVLEASPKVY